MSLSFERKKQIKVLTRNYALFWAGFIVPLILWQTVYFILKYYLAILPMDYFDQLWTRTTYHTGFSFGYGGMLPFFLTIARFEGLLIMPLLSCGFVVLCLIRNRDNVCLLIVFLATFSLYTFRPHHFLRIFSLAIPCFYLIAGIFLCWMIEGIRRRRIFPRAIAQCIIIALVLFAAVTNINRDAKIIRWRSRYKEAIEFLMKQETRNHFSTVSRLSQYYVDNESVQHPPREEGIAPGKQAIAEFPYLLIDKQRYYQTTFGPSTSDWIQKVQKNCSPVFEEREDFDELFFEHFAFEHSIDYWETSAFLKHLSIPEAAMLRIYSLWNCK